jgi:serine/threonine protein kinase
VLPSTTVPRGVFTLHTDASGTAPPDAFGPFRVLHQIGAGVLGPVFRAYQPDPGRLVAVKQFRLDLPPENAHRFVAALDRLIAADLTHLGIAAPLAAGLTDNAPYLAQDFVAAESFDVVIRDYGPAPVTEALRIATQLGAALDFAAAVNVFHGTLHPRDVLVSTDDTRVTGLGIAQALEQLGVAPPVRRPYTAPERVAGAVWDRRADTFSLAALVYEMLFGRRIAGLGQDAADAITPVEDADPSALRKLFAKALAEDPADRFDTALSFAEALHGVLSPPALPAKAARRSRSRDNGASLPARGSRSMLPLESDEELPLSLAEERARASQDASEGHPAAPAADAEERPRATEEPESTPAGSRAMLGDIRGTASEPMAPVSDERDEGHSAGPPQPPVAPTHVDVDEDSESRDASSAAAGSHFGDLDLRAAEDARYTLADSESALPERAEQTVAEEAAFETSAPPHPSVDAGALGARDPYTEHGTPNLAIGMRASEGSSRAHEELELHSLASVALEQSRSAVWPIVLALLVGLSVGFAGGYTLFVTRDRANGGTPTSRDVNTTADATSTAADRTPASQPLAPATPVRPAEESSRGAARGSAAPAAPAAAPPAVVPQAAPPRPRVATPPERSAAETGRLLIRSSPASARVTLDGRDVGVTPLTLNNVSRGAHVVRIAHQGYVTAERRVRIRATQPAQSIEVDLVATRAAREAAAPPPPAPERTSGSLMVDSRPAGARVFVDGKLAGTTPMLLDAVAVGDHAVRLELDGFNPWTSTARVVGGERIRVSGSLEQR